MVSRYRRGLTSLAIIAVSFFGERSLQAGVITYSDLGQFEAAAGALSEEGFAIAGIDDVGLFLSSLDATTNSPPVLPGSIVGGVKFRSESGSGLWLVPAGFELAHGDDVVDSTFLFTQVAKKPLILEFASGATAVGADVLGYAPSDGTVDITWMAMMDDGASYSGMFSRNSGEDAFFGVTTAGTSRISWLSFTPTNDHVAVDNVLFREAQQPPGLAVPEPASLVGWSLLAGALVIAAGKPCRKRIR